MAHEEDGHQINVDIHSFLYVHETNIKSLNSWNFRNPIMDSVFSKTRQKINVVPL